MIPYISMLEGNFTRYNMEFISKMNSVYGIRFYELMKSWLFGEARKKKTVEITAEEMAEKLDTISYEVFCNISYRVPRVYLK